MEEELVRGTVYRLGGGVEEAGDGARLSAFGLELFLASWTLRPEGSGGDVLLVKDWERLFLGLSSKNSITKAL